jgi:hypothetical protein
MKKTILEKLKSRKLWAAIVGVIVGLAAAFGIDGNDYAEIAGIVTSAISVVSYIFAEGKVDAAYAENSFSVIVPEKVEEESAE